MFAAIADPAQSAATPNLPMPLYSGGHPVLNFISRFRQHAVFEHCERKLMEILSRQHCEHLFVSVVSGISEVSGVSEVSDIPEVSGVSDASGISEVPAAGVSEVS